MQAPCRGLWAKESLTGTLGAARCVKFCDTSQGMIFARRGRTHPRAATPSAAAPIPGRGYAFGSRTTNRAPSTFPAASRRLSALIRPRSPSMICLEMDRPSPECWPKRSPRGRSL